MAQDRSPHPAKARAAAETLAEARRLYETTTLTQAEIAGRLGLYSSSISRMAKRDGWRRPADAAARRALVGSIRETVDAEMAEIDRILNDGGTAAGASVAERARTLASLVRTLRELARYDEDQARAAAPPAAGDRGEDEAVTDLDALREELARRLERLRKERGQECEDEREDE